MNWYCLCGNFVYNKRFCPKCKLVRFDIREAPILDFWGMRVGYTKNGLPFNFPQSRFSNHVIISGQTGSGKTRFAMNLVSKIARNNVNLLVIDVEGEWKNIIPSIRNKTNYHTVDKNLKINPFDLGDPALIRELMKETVFKGIEKEYTDLSAQMNFVLQETIRQSHNMKELIENIKSYNSHKLTALQKTKTALLVRLDPFLRSPLKEIFLCDNSSPDFTKISKENTIIDLHVLDSRVAYKSELRLIYNIITVYFLRKMLEKISTDRITNLFVADEAQLLVPKILHKLIVTESWPATEFATRLRKRGCGMILITQSPSNIEKDILKNAGTKISFRLQHLEDIKIIAEASGFTDITELEYLSNQFVNLSNRDAIVSTYGFEPFLITSEEYNSESYEPQIAHETVPEKEPESADEFTFLESISKEPFLPVRQRRKSLGWADKRYTGIVNSLLSKKRIEIQKASVNRGKPITLYQTPQKIPSVRHQFYVDWIKQRIEKLGLETVQNIKEGPDIVIPSINCAIEVELGSSNVQYNISQNVTKHQTVIVTSDQKKLLQSLSDQNKVQNVLFLPIRLVPDQINKMLSAEN